MRERLDVRASSTVSFVFSIVEASRVPEELVVGSGRPGTCVGGLLVTVTNRHSDMLYNYNRYISRM